MLHTPAGYPTKKAPAKAGASWYQVKLYQGIAESARTFLVIQRTIQSYLHRQLLIGAGRIPLLHDRSKRWQFICKRFPDHFFAYHGCTTR